ncbi:MAG: EAL domain-containing protein [Lachnospiraceae bacterium]|jgi:diguanylate cyclase (GGDEF)-like protein/PAS domain S-box-containing protein|nr:EAL domain-containing protein [Lachnospiraceae bacterium]
MKENERIQDEKLQDVLQDELLLLMNSSECAMFIAKSGSEIELIYANDKFYSMLQYTKEEYIDKFGNSFMASVLTEEKQKLRTLIARQAAAGGTLKLEYRAVRKDNSVAWLSLSAKAVVRDNQLIYYSSCIDVTKTKKTLDDIYNAKREIDVMANSIPGGVIKVRMSDFKLIYANDGYFMLTGYSRAEFHMEYGGFCDSVLYPSDVDEVKRYVKLAIENHGLLGFECRLVSKSGDIKWVYVSGRRIDDDNGQPVYLCILTDVTAKKNIESEFEDNLRRAEVIAGILKAVLWTYDIASSKIKQSGMLESTYSQQGRPDSYQDLQEMIQMLHPEDEQRIKDSLAQIKKTKGQLQVRLRVRNSVGIFQDVEINAASICDTEGKPCKIYGMTRVVNEPAPDTVLDREKNENRLITLAKTASSKTEDDSITGLMPYSAFLSKADKILRDRGDKKRYAILCADINEFLKFSHHYGFSISNQILKIFSQVLLNNIAKDGLCSRVDGDYFVVMFQYADHKELMRLMSSMVRSKEEFDEQDGSVRFGTTTGIYLVQPEDDDLADMLEKADLARRSIKGLMGNHYAIYTEDLKKDRFKEEEIVDEIYNSMRSRSIEICFMPRIYKDKSNVIGCKAIPRVLLKDGQYIESVKLLKFIERGGKLNEFAFVTLSSVCANMGAWKGLGNRIVPLSIEMTASELSMQNTVDIIDDIVIRRNNLEPSDIIFEIHERYFAEGTTVFDMNVDSLCKKGYQVVISRFGSDHTAVNALKRLPVTGIKFHGGFFNENTSNREKVIFGKVVEMAKELGLSVTCGGIQTKQQEDFAKAIGCEVFEGEMYYGKVRHNVFEKCFLSD